MRKLIKILYLTFSYRLYRDLSLGLTYNLFQSLGSLCYFFLHVISFTLITRTFAFPSYSQHELPVFLYTFQFFTYTMFYISYNGLRNTSKDISSGAFDYLLTKPLNSQYLSTLRGGGAHNFLLSAFSLVALLIALVAHHLPIHPLGILLFLAASLISISVAHNISTIFITLNFRFGYLPSLHLVTAHVQEVYKYPATLYQHRGFLVALLFIPLSLLTSLPASLLLLRPVPLPFIVLYFSFALLIHLAAAASWRAGLRHYSSAS